MSTLLISSPAIPTLGDLLERLGGIPAARVRYHPLPGTATEHDVLDIEARENIHCELVDGVLVEKPMGLQESYLAVLIATILNNFVLPRKLGIVTGADGTIRLFPNSIRIPDVAFISDARLPGGLIPREPIPTISPDLAVEVLSASNTVREMQRKRGEYFAAGILLIWMVDPAARTVTVYLPDAEPVIVGEGESLSGDPVLPGLAMDVTELFKKLPQ